MIRILAKEASVYQTSDLKSINQNREATILNQNILRNLTAYEHLQQALLLHQLLLLLLLPLLRLGPIQHQHITRHILNKCTSLITH